MFAPGLSMARCSGAKSSGAGPSPRGYLSREKDHAKTQRRKDLSDRETVWIFASLRLCAIFSSVGLGRARNLSLLLGLRRQRGEPDGRLAPDSRRPSAAAQRRPARLRGDSLLVEQRDLLAVNELA